MKKKYTIELPKELNNNFSSLFKKKQKYIYVQKENSTILKNVFISNIGTILHNYLIPINSAENLIGSTDKNFYFTRWKLAIEQCIVSKYGKSLKAYHCDSKHTYFSIHTPWFGYFSWITTYLPRLITAMEKFPHAYLLYPEEWDNISYVKDTLKLFSNLKIKKIPKDHHIFVPNYLLIPCRKWTSHFDTTTLEKLREILYNKLNIALTNTPNKKIYISRKKANRRKINNEDELELLLKSFNIESICFEDITFHDQVKSMSEAKLVIASHGAGLTNINFLNKNASVIELTPRLSNYHKFRYPFWRMASLLELNYYCLFCERTNSKNDEYECDMQINLDELKNLLKKIT